MLDLAGCMILNPQFLTCCLISVPKLHHSPCRKAAGLGHMNMMTSFRAAPAAILQADFAVMPALPLSPHVHVVGSLTSRPAQPLQGELKRLCEAAGRREVVVVSMGTTAVPGKPL